MGKKAYFNPLPAFDATDIQKKSAVIQQMKEYNLFNWLKVDATRRKRLKKRKGQLVCR